MRRTLSTLLAVLFLCAALPVARAQDTRPAAGAQERRIVVPVLDVDNPGLNPFHQSFELILQFLLPTAESAFDVPEGRRLVIEHVSVLAQGQASSTSPWGLRCAVSTMANGQPASLIVNLGTVGFQAGLNQISVGNLHGRAYADPGSVVRTVCTRVNFSSRSVSASISIIGHLLRQ